MVRRSFAVALGGFALVMHLVFACYFLTLSNHWAYVQFLCLPVMALAWYAYWWVASPLPFFPRNRFAAFVDTHQKKIMISGLVAIGIFWLPLILP